MDITSYEFSLAWQEPSVISNNAELNSACQTEWFINKCAIAVLKLNLIPELNLPQQ